MNTLEAIRVLDAAMALAVQTGISIARYQEMRAEAGGNLTDAQVEQLANESDAAVDRM